MCDADWLAKMARQRVKCVPPLVARGPKGGVSWVLLVLPAESLGSGRSAAFIGSAGAEKMSFDRSREDGCDIVCFAGVSFRSSKGV